MKGFLNIIKFFTTDKTRFFVVWEEETGKYLYLETPWSKKEVNSVKVYDWNTWKQKGFKWKVVSEHKNKLIAEAHCNFRNKNK
jgi:hypothetical protein